MSTGPLLISTLASSPIAATQARARVPCLTIACHPDPQRIGERALLTPLLVRQVVRLSRSEPLFGHPGSELMRPLEDPYLSRKPIRITRSPDAGGFRLEGLPERAKLDGETVGSACTLEDRALRGTLLQLSSRILLLLHETAAEALTPVDGILGASDALDRVRRQILKVAELETPVLIRGETGVGKECVARALHTHSRRSDHQLVAVNMATLSEGTAAAALFGYARGAFTGANARHRGFFEQADGGTLFLDEVGDTPQSVQPMLLRALETGKIQPLGDEQERSVNVRVIAASEVDLEAGVRAGAFRAALRHRLAGYEILVPPLRERPEDIPRLFVHFLRSELQALGRDKLLDYAPRTESPPLQAEFLSRLARLAFPGNVRELLNLARAAAISMLDSGQACLPHSEAFPKPHATETSAPAAQTDATPMDQRTLVAVLERCDFSPLRVAGELGVPSSTVHYWMQKAGILRASDFRTDELAQVVARHEGDLHAAAKQLRVSVRALKLALRRDPATPSTVTAHAVAPHQHRPTRP